MTSADTPDLFSVDEWAAIIHQSWCGNHPPTIHDRAAAEAVVARLQQAATTQTTGVRWDGRRTYAGPWIEVPAEQPGATE